MANIGSQYRTMQEIVYETIKDRILKGQYAPGQRLITNDLATELGVSRMPVREALQRLDAATGLVTLIPHKGAVVNDSSSEEDLLEIFHIRAVLEGLAARLACPTITEEQIAQLVAINEKVLTLENTVDEEHFQDLNLEFHSTIWGMTHSPRLVGMLKSLYDASRGYRYISVKLPGRLDEIVHEHSDIIAAFRSKDPNNVEVVVNNHYQHTLEWLIRSIQDKKQK
ncbi:MAG: GntR family transcriptional regulator [Anaerolineae bacterium]|nr:GntR family transcriptional regulator [Anaerolineae bacterium]